ncbi:hypothetical protein [Mesorhizobium loti]|uniref:Uncharacterized protein n=1 Tax=Rhizobium loti TaxID=381 RepID=A0A6M7U3T0_RHILI|nr:hypothetical protein [Mesorhizobium loti]OBQ72245.1 hypothetical protein A8145_05335 [Mesorhizobium loti]QKC72159.1 hypothetical protein EB815_25645 [Mesorhizobium loti]
MVFREVIGDKVMHDCDLCGRSVQMGQGLYEGTHLHELDGTFCRGCFSESAFSPAQRAKGVSRIKGLLAKKKG